jgi:hypothetical protein
MELVHQSILAVGSYSLHPTNLKMVTGPAAVVLLQAGGVVVCATVSNL